MTRSEEDPIILAIAGKIKLPPRAGLTEADFEAFLAARRAEGRQIDPKLLRGGPAQGGGGRSPWAVDLSGNDGLGCIQGERFVRNSPDDPWVWEGGLPEKF